MSIVEDIAARIGLTTVALLAELGVPIDSPLVRSSNDAPEWLRYALVGLLISRFRLPLEEACTLARIVPASPSHVEADAAE